MKRNLFVMALVTSVSGVAQADLAKAFNCHDEQKLFNEENCKSLLIGLAISSWRRYMSKNPQAFSLTTVESMQLTLNSLGLICRK